VPENLSMNVMYCRKLKITARSHKDFAMRVCGAGLRLISAQDEGGDK
jgi:hypothetical protein